MTFGKTILIFFKYGPNQRLRWVIDQPMMGVYTEQNTWLPRLSCSHLSSLDFCGGEVGRQYLKILIIYIINNIIKTKSEMHSIFG